MDNYQAGDLTDILRAGSSTGSIPSNLSDQHQESRHTAHTWHYPSDHPMNFSSSSSSCAHMEAEEEGNKDNFGDPFSSYLRDPLLRELDLSGSSFFSSSKSPEMSMDGGGGGVVTTATTFAGDGGGLLGHRQGGTVEGDPVNKRPPTIFSRMLQISPSAKVPVSPSDISPLMGAPVPCKTSASSAMVGGDMIINGNSSSGGKGGCLLENTGMQISSPRNPGIKRRKSQAKQVVCIPAPAAANSRPTGEVVPSDLWAWRKYGQKPIKGSPYPRGYYRCSSSKGCSARKQVERSRTDPNMLVITYTSEHNHPWPTQRNALAGSTRSQPSKNAGASKTSTNSSHHHQKPSSLTKEEQKIDTITNMSSDCSDNNTSQVSQVISAGGTSTVKEEFDQKIEKKLQLHHYHHQHQFNGHDDHQEGFAYRPSMPDDNQSNHHHEDFFADLGEIEADPLNLLFSQCFTADEQQKAGSKDPFNIFDWSSGDTQATATAIATASPATTTTNNSNTATSFGEANKRML